MIEAAHSLNQQIKPHPTRWHYPLINYLTHLIVFWRLCSVEAVLGQQQLQHSGLQPLQCSSTWLATPATVWCRTAHWYQMSKICQKIISLVSCDFTIFFSSIQILADFISFPMQFTFFSNDCSLFCSVFSRIFSSIQIQLILYYFRLRGFLALHIQNLVKLLGA